MGLPASHELQSSDDRSTLDGEHAVLKTLIEPTGPPSYCSPPDQSDQKGARRRDLECSLQACHKVTTTKRVSTADTSEKSVDTTGTVTAK